MSFFLKKTDDVNDLTVRARCGKRAGLLGIVLNTLLAGGKIAVGALSGAISVLADGLNNLTDCGSNVVSVIGFKMSEKPADKEHPFGHRRAESVASLLIAVIILVVAVELAVSSAEKILSPAETDFSYLLMGVLGISIAVKLFMFFLNRNLGKKLSSEALLATAADSISDTVATALVLVSAVVSRFTNVDLDGWLGIAVALFIAFTGFTILKDTVSGLLGRAPSKQTVDDIEKRVLSFAGVKGVHDLIVHDYGQNKMYVTVHVEVSDDLSITEAHDLADSIEKDFAAETGIELTVHIDPLVYGDPEIDRLKEEAEKIVQGIDPAFLIHDFRVVGGEQHKNLVFEVAIPFECALSETEVLRRIRDDVAKLNGGSCGCVVTVERQNL